MTEPSELKRKEALEYIEAGRDATPEERLHKMKQAEALLQEALEMNPKNHRARFLLVSTAMSTEDFSRAKKEGLEIYNSLTPAQRRKMGDAVLHISLTHASKMLGDTSDAFKFCGEAAEFFPEDPHPHMILGELHEAKEENLEAEMKCRDALRINADPDCKHKLNQQSLYFTKCCLGAVLLREGKYADAEKFLQSAHDMQQPHTLAMRHLVDVYDCQGRHHEALEMAEELLAKDPSDEELLAKVEALKHGSNGKEPQELSVPAKPKSKKGLGDVSESDHHSDKGAGSHLEDDGSGITTKSKLKTSQRRGRSGSESEAKSKRGERSPSRDAGGNDSFLCCCFDKEKGR